MSQMWQIYSLDLQNRLYMFLSTVCSHFQANELEFNRAMLMNVGYIEALNYTQWDCFIFHDVDHIPLSHGNFYGCSGMPKHFLSGADRWGYK